MLSEQIEMPFNRCPHLPHEFGCPPGGEAPVTGNHIGFVHKGNYLPLPLGQISDNPANQKFKIGVMPAGERKRKGRLR